MALSDPQLRRAEIREKPYKLYDTGGLYAIVTPRGRIWWRFDYRLGGKRRTISFGTHPEVKLVQARDRRDAARAALADGRDPANEKRREALRLRLAAGHTFDVVAQEWLAAMKDVYAPRTWTKTEYILRLHVLPTLGRRPIAELEPPDILVVLRSVQQRGKRETAHRAKQIIGQIFRHAIADGRAKRDPTPDLRGALLPVVTTHHAALTNPDAIGALLRAIDGLDAWPPVVAAVKLAPLVFVRPGELRSAEWSEIDLDRALWQIPAPKMKMRADHLVPLSRQAVALLRSLKAITGNEPDQRFVFPSVRTRRRPMSENTVNVALRRLGYTSEEMTGHGFRAMARTLLDERLRVRPEIIELQLAHRTPGALGSTYNRARYLEERAAMMQRWADYLDELRAATTTARSA